MVGSTAADMTGFHEEWNVFLAEVLSQLRGRRSCLELRRTAAPVPSCTCQSPQVWYLEESGGTRETRGWLLQCSHSKPCVGTASVGNKKPCRSPDPVIPVPGLSVHPNHYLF